MNKYSLLLLLALVGCFGKNKKEEAKVEDNTGQAADSSSESSESAYEGNANSADTANANKEIA